jgi:hypothetical protein
MHSESEMNDLTRHLVPTIRQTTGKAYPALERDLGKLPPDAQQDLLRLLRYLQDKASSANRKARMGFPF